MTEYVGIMAETLFPQVPYNHNMNCFIRYYYSEVRLFLNKKGDIYIAD